VYLAVLSLSKPQRTETPFIEVSRCVAVSIASTATAILLFALVPWIWRDRWPAEVTAAVKNTVTGTTYALDHLYVVAGVLLLEVVLAMAVAAGAALLVARRSSRARIKYEPVWSLLFRRKRPPGTKPWVTAYMKGGHRYEGDVIAYTVDDVPMDERELVIGPAPYAQPRDGKREQMADLARLVIPGAELESLGVTYHLEAPVAESDPS
jgi:hypothetical protein